MIYKLVCAGDNSFEKIYSKENNELIIAIDGGYEILDKMNIKVDYYFGDNDSLKNKNIVCENILKYNPVKDDSDFDLAIKYLIENMNIKKNDMIYVYNATGGRLDHFYAILNTIIKYSDYNICLFNENNRIFMINDSLEITDPNYKYISFFSVDDDTIISIFGMKYNISNYNLKRQDNICLSNEIINDGYIITNKKVLVIQSK